MASRGEEKKKQSARKLARKPKAERRTSVQFPEQLQYGEDVEEDATAPDSSRGPQYINLNQSVFSLIAAAGSKTDLHARFDDDSSGSNTETEHEDDDEGAKLVAKETHTPNRSQLTDNIKKSRSTRHSTRLHDSTILRSIPKLSIRNKREKNYMSQSVILPPREEKDSLARTPRATTPRDAPIMSMMLEAQAKLDPHKADMEESRDQATASIDMVENKTSVSLEKRLMEIFALDEPEEVISEYPCWFLQSILLQGFMYITSRHICFYAYLPQKSTVVAKSGHLAKKGKQSPSYTRYWFILKGDKLSYFLDPSDLYFPSGNIDLRYGISAAVSEGRDKEFTVTTHHRTYHFRADSAVSAREWVKTLQKTIFRSHNDGDSVKISIPLDNVLDIEESKVTEFADTFKVRVIDSDETYAIDEYYFSFFSFGKDALEVLRALISHAPARRKSMDLLSSHPGSPLEGSQTPEEAPVLRESVRATLSPDMPPVSGKVSPRMSGEWNRKSAEISRRSMEVNRLDIDYRRSFEDRGRHSVSAGRMSPSTSQEPHSTKPAQDSTESFVQSLDPSTASSVMGATNIDGSASQILSRSDVFHSPTISRLARSPDRIERERKSPKDGSSDPTGDNIVVSPPSRSQTDKSALKFDENHFTPRVSYDNQDEGLHESSSAPSIQQLVRDSFPVQKAAGIATYLRKGSKRMSALLAAESMGYVEKVSGMWAGGKRHYGDGQGMPDDEGPIVDDEVDGHGDRFRAHFGLMPSEKLQAAYFGFLHRVLPLYGKIYIGTRHFCFRSLLPGTKTKLVLPLAHIENVTKERAMTGLVYSGLAIVIRAHEELFFEFRSLEDRDDCAVTLLQNLESIRYLQESGILSQEEKSSALLAKEEHKMLQEARMQGHAGHDINLPKSVPSSAAPEETPPILFDDPRASIINFKPTESLRITCLTIGSRGDVQPYIALCKGLLAEGHRPKIATHSEFEPWVRQHGIDFAPVDGDPAELMRVCVENGMFTFSFFKETTAKFRGWIDELLSSAWKACRDTDILVESPSAMAGIHIAEALEIPYFRAFTMPWSRTRAYPHAFAVPERKMGGTYNYMTYVMFDNVFWAATAGQINRWRKKELGLRSTSLEKLHPNKVPFLYNFSPSVVVPPLDYSDWIRVTGYWFLDEASDWSPPTELTGFINKARQDKKKLVYIGFGSIVVADPAGITKTIVAAVKLADVRCILSKGWSDRLGGANATKSEVPLPPEIHQIKSAPHDWLFRQIDAVAHHGGAGTTGASLRAGKPTIIKPFFGDQYFFGDRVEDLGVGVHLKKLNSTLLGRALWEATHSERMIVKARVLGEQIRQETGVDNAIKAIYRDLEYAKTLTKRKNPDAQADNDIGDEESWTFIGDESDPELIRRIAEWEPMREGEERSTSVKPEPPVPASKAGLGIKFLKRGTKVT